LWPLTTLGPVHPLGVARTTIGQCRAVTLAEPVLVKIAGGAAAGILAA